MTLYKNTYRIESNRMPNWDYSRRGVYFITICTVNRECLFGDIKKGKMYLNWKGEILRNEIQKSVQIRERWIFHNWVIMPNHIHLLVEIKEEYPKYNYSENKILDNSCNIDESNIFLNRNKETHRIASQQVNNANQEMNSIASQQEEMVNDGFVKEIDLNNTGGETHNSTPQQEEIANDGFVKEIDLNNTGGETHCSAPQQEEVANDGFVKDIDFNNTGGETHCSAPQQEEVANDGFVKEIDLNNSGGEKHCSTSHLELYRKPKSISSFVAVLKSKVTKQICELEGKLKESVWQSNYHDSIVSNKDEFKKVFYYIQNNPKNWKQDSLNF